MNAPGFTRLGVIALTACALLGAAACGSSSKAKPPPAPTDMRNQAQVTIDAHNNQFSPVDVIVTVGTKVTWHNVDPVVHNVKKSADALDFGAPFGTDDLNPGGTYSFTFAKTGTFFYSCTIHAGMSAKVEVVAK